MIISRPAFRPDIDGLRGVFTGDNHLTATFRRSVAPELGARLSAALR